jgi:hypothetical protein
MGESQRQPAREEVRHDVAFNIGFFAIMLPIVAVGAGALGVVAGLATALEALITVALMVLLWVSMNDNWRIGTLLHRAIVTGTAEVVVRLGPVPVAGAIAQFLGYTVVLWLPVVTLAAAALLM